MDTLKATYGIWSTQFATHLTVLQTVATVAGYANLHAAAVAQVAVR